MLIIALSIIAIVVALEIAALLLLKRDERVKGYLSAAILVVITIHKLRKRFFPEKDRENARFYDEIYIGENARLKEYEGEGKNVQNALFILLVTSAFYVFASLAGIFKGEYITNLIRPGSGTDSRVIIAEYKDKEYSVNVDVSRTEPKQKEKEEIFNEVKGNIVRRVLGDNASADAVLYNLRFDNNIDDTGVTAYYQSSNPEIITASGVVNSKEIATDTEVRVNIHLSYYDFRDELELTLKVVPFSEESVVHAMLNNEVEAAEIKDKYEKVVELPDEIDGEAVRFKVGEKSDAYLIVVLGVCAAFLMIPLSSEQKKTLKRNRAKELILDYPELVSKLALLIEAGLTVRVAFERIAADYERRRARKGARGKCEKRYVYEEIIRARNELSLGIAEQDVYTHFGRRCGSMFYIRLAALLSQNVKKGGESLVISLKQEIREAHKEKSAQIKKAGEEISMKLLIPMMGMFTIVLLTILIPSFLSV